MAINLAGLSGGVMKWITSVFFWVIMIIIILTVAFMVLYIRKKARFKTKIFEWIALGNGKTLTIPRKAGFFGKNRIIFGLIDYGSEHELITNERKPRKILNISSEDYHFFNEGRCLHVKRKDDDNKILVPLYKIEITNAELLADIAPADYRDASIDIIQSATSELSNKTMQVIAMVVPVITSIIFLVCLVLVIRYASSEMDKIYVLFEKGCSGILPTVSSAP